MVQYQGEVIVHQEAPPRAGALGASLGPACDSDAGARAAWATVVGVGATFFAGSAAGFDGAAADPACCGAAGSAGADGVEGAAGC